METMVRRKQSRRTFRELSGGYSKPPPSPWIGKIIRYFTPTVISDYASLATGSWTSAQFYDAWKPSPVTFGGDLINCQYHLLAAPASASDGAESSVILPPVRFTISEAAATDDPMVAFEAFTTSTFSTFRPLAALNRNLQTFAQTTLLPVSGDSHVSDGTPTRIELNFGITTDVSMLQILPHAAYTLLGWAGNTTALNWNMPTNWVIGPRYIQFRKAGASYGSLVDRRAEIDRVGTVGGTYTNRLRKSYYYPTVTFPSSPIDSDHPESEQESWTFSFTAGDDLEVDIWIEARIRNDGAAETNSLLINLLETNDTYSQLIASGHAGGGWTKVLDKRIDRAAGFVLNGLEVSATFDPSTDTYEFTPADGTFTLGKAIGPAILFSVDSKQLLWQYDASTPASYAVTFSTTESSGASTTTKRIEFLTVAVGAVLTLEFVEGGDVFTYTSTTTDINTFASDVKTALDAFIAARSGDPYWGSVTTAIPPANPWVINVTYPDTLTLTVTGSSYSPPVFKQVYLELHYDEEMAWMQLAKTGVSGVALYRPQSSGDYVNQVDDEFEGTMNCGPTGVFDYLGSTVFELWRGSMAPAYDGRGSLSTDFPSSITVVKVAQ